MYKTIEYVLSVEHVAFTYCNALKQICTIGYSSKVNALLFQEVSSRNALDFYAKTEITNL